MTGGQATQSLAMKPNLALYVQLPHLANAFFCRKAMGLLVRAGGSAIAPPHPLSEKETRAFARELHTVNVGKAQAILHMAFGLLHSAS